MIRAIDMALPAGRMLAIRCGSVARLAVYSTRSGTLRQNVVNFAPTGRRSRRKPKVHRMTQLAKLYARLLADPNTIIRFRDFEALLRAFGFTARPGKGSHTNWKHPELLLLLTAQPRGKDAVPYQVKRLLAVVREHDLHVGE